MHVGEVDFAKIVEALHAPPSKEFEGVHMTQDYEGGSPAIGCAVFLQDSCRWALLNALDWAASSGASICAPVLAPMRGRSASYPSVMSAGLHFPASCPASCH